MNDQDNNSENQDNMAVTNNLSKESGKQQVASALVKAQNDFPSIKKDKEVSVKTKTGGSYKFSYAPFDSMREQTRHILANHGLCVVQHEHDGWLITTLYHESGQCLYNKVRIIYNNGNAQEYGSALTYARRYGYSALLGIASEDDDDANMSVGNSIESQKVKQPYAPAEPSDDLVQDCLAAIEACSTLSELKTTFQDFHNSISRDYPNSKALKMIIDKTNKRKAELE